MGERQQQRQESRDDGRQGMADRQQNRADERSEAREDRQQYGTERREDRQDEQRDEREPEVEPPRHLTLRRYDIGLAEPAVEADAGESDAVGDGAVFVGCDESSERGVAGVDAGDFVADG